MAQSKKAVKNSKKEVKEQVAQVEAKKIIFAEKANKLWKVYILNLTDKSKEAEFFFHSPLKAMKYCLIQKAQTGIRISKNAIKSLSNDYQASKL